MSYTSTLPCLQSDAQPLLSGLHTTVTVHAQIWQAESHIICIYTKCSDMFLLFISCNEFTGMPIETPLDSSIMWAAYTGYMQSKLLRKTYIRVQLGNGIHRAWRWNHHLEIVHTVSRSMARFTIWSHCYIQTRQISHNMDNFTFFILLNKQQSGLKTNQTKGIWLK
jgi:hypothetical protein